MVAVEYNNTLGLYKRSWKRLFKYILMYPDKGVGRLERLLYTSVEIVACKVPDLPTTKYNGTQ